MLNAAQITVTCLISVLLAVILIFIFYKIINLQTGKQAKRMKNKDKKKGMQNRVKLIFYMQFMIQKCFFSMFICSLTESWKTDKQKKQVDNVPPKNQKNS